MSTVSEIKEAIGRLAPRDYCELMAALHPFEDDDWDRQMQADSKSGKYATMNRAADEAHAAGRTLPLGDIIEGKN